MDGTSLTGDRAASMFNKIWSRHVVERLRGIATAAEMLR